MDVSLNKFRRKSSDYEHSLSNVFKTLKANGDLLDVTLATKEGNLSAHRVVLSSCSPVLSSLLRPLPSHPFPLVYLRGVHLTHLTHLLTFFYEGEVAVSQQDLQGLLDLADELQVPGLAPSSDSQSSSTPGPPPPKRRHTEEEGQVSDPASEETPRDLTAQRHPPPPVQHTTQAQQNPPPQAHQQQPSAQQPMKTEVTDDLPAHHPPPAHQLPPAQQPPQVPLKTEIKSESTVNIPQAGHKPLNLGSAPQETFTPAGPSYTPSTAPTGPSYTPSTTPAGPSLYTPSTAPAGPSYTPSTTFPGHPLNTLKLVPTKSLVASPLPGTHVQILENRSLGGWMCSGCSFTSAQLDLMRGHVQHAHTFGNRGLYHAQ